jgi:hypothetical protein
MPRILPGYPSGSAGSASPLDAVVVVVEGLAGAVESVVFDVPPVPVVVEDDFPVVAVVAVGFGLAVGFVVVVEPDLAVVAVDRAVVAVDLAFVVLVVDALARVVLVVSRSSLSPAPPVVEVVAPFLAVVVVVGLASSGRGTAHVVRRDPS